MLNPGVLYDTTVSVYLIAHRFEKLGGYGKHKINKRSMAQHTANAMETKLARPTVCDLTPHEVNAWRYCRMRQIESIAVEWHYNKMFLKLRMGKDLHIYYKKVNSASFRTLKLVLPDLLTTFLFLEK